jgi:hypothetical protein
MKPIGNVNKEKKSGLVNDKQPSVYTYGGWGSFHCSDIYMCLCLCIFIYRYIYIYTHVHMFIKSIYNPMEDVGVQTKYLSKMWKSNIGRSIELLN